MTDTKVNKFQHISDKQYKIKYLYWGMYERICRKKQGMCKSQQQPVQYHTFCRRYSLALVAEYEGSLQASLKLVNDLLCEKCQHENQ